MLLEVKVYEIVNGKLLVKYYKPRQLSNFK